MSKNIKSYYYEAPPVEDYIEAITRSNAIVVEAREARAVLAQILKPFYGKRCGEKTRAKITDAARALGWQIYISPHGTDSTAYVSRNKVGALRFQIDHICDCNNVITNIDIFGEYGYIVYDRKGYRIATGTVDNVTEAAEKLHAEAVRLFDTLQKAAEAVESYNAATRGAVPKLYGFNLHADMFNKIIITTGDSQ